MKRKSIGSHVVISTVGEKAEAFVPNKLIKESELAISKDLRVKYEKALLSIGKLDAHIQILKNPEYLLFMSLRKEAVLSSRIEGTQSSLSDLLLYEVKEDYSVKVDDVVEVSRYLKALEFAVQKLKDGFPISNRLIKEMHKILLESGRGKNKQPGEFRKSQNWIGGTRPGNAVFVPPPATEVVRLMSDLEKYINNQPLTTSPLIKSALSHVQFETIHPFLDGNGRVGRLLILLILISEEIIKTPMLYISLFFKQNQKEYYHLLNLVRKTGDWEKWLDFYFEAITKTSKDVVSSIDQIKSLFEKDEETVEKLGRKRISGRQVLEEFQSRPILSAAMIVESRGLAFHTVNERLKDLIKLKIIKEISGKERDRVYSYQKYYKIINGDID